jgi:DEAD/DEAH box helicase domain-containing protein
MENVVLNEFFERLERIFRQINTHFTFLASHSRSTIPSLDLIQKLNPDISAVDLQCIKQLCPPGEVFFDYVDENQLLLAKVEPLKFDFKSGYSQHKPPGEDYQLPSDDESPQDNASKHILVFDFQDTKIDGIQAVIKGVKRKRNMSHNDNSLFFLASSNINIQTLTHEQLMMMIKGRNEKFCRLVSEYILKFDLVDLAQESLLESSKASVPVQPSFEDPVEMLKSKRVRAATSTKQPSLDEMVELLTTTPFYRDQLVGTNFLSRARVSRYSPLVTNQIHPELRQGLLDYKGVDLETHLYTHQTEALDALLDQEQKNHIIVSTSTGSGKSLIYQLPILNDLLWDRMNNWPKRSSTACFIFPTKALAQDQKRHLEDFLRYLPSLSGTQVATYDGDTPKDDRKFIRNNAEIIFTNPDAIHASILPNYELGWTSYLAGLKYVVMDEIHVYKGIFGINVSYIMARLLRMAFKQGNSNVRFVSCSATIQDPQNHFRVVCSIPRDDNIVHISNDGSPTVDKKLLVWRPPALMNKKGQIVSKDSMSKFNPRESVITELAKILVKLLTSFPNIKVLVFCSIRKVCEIMTKEIRSLLKKGDYENVTGVVDTDIMSYRGGYSKSDRRVIEEKMFNGKLRAIVATNALELGIDLSDLDVVITCGFPVLKLNLHQQFGRAGRARDSQGSLAIFVGGSNPLDLYYLKNWQELLDRQYEDLCVSGLIEMGSNTMSLEQHLQCAAFESPIHLIDDVQWFTNQYSGPDRFIKICEKCLHKDIDGTYRTDPKYLPWPSEKVSIRNIEQITYAVVDITNKRNIVIEEVEELRTPFTLYEGGIFLHQGYPYLIKEFNSTEHFATVERVNVDWITQQRDFTDINPSEIEYVKQFHPPNASEPSDIPVFYGKVESRVTVFGYFKVSRRGEIMEAVEVDNRPILMKSKGFWIDIPLSAIEIIKEKSLNPAGGIHAAQHAIMNMLPMFISGGATTNPNAKFTSNVGDAELTTECKAPEKEFSQRQSKRKRPGRLIFIDSKGGERGSGMSAKTFEYIDAIISATYDRVSNCECEWGCPSCVTATLCSENSIVMSKPASIIILAAILGMDMDVVKTQVRDGPEANIPQVETETIENASQVRFASDVEIVKYRKIPKRPVFKTDTHEIKEVEQEFKIKVEDADSR